MGRAGRVTARIDLGLVYRNKYGRALSVPTLKESAARIYLDFLEREVVGILTLRRLLKNGGPENLMGREDIVQAAYGRLRQHIEDYVGTQAEVLGLLVALAQNKRYPSCKQKTDSDLYEIPRRAFKDRPGRDFWERCYLPCCMDAFVPEEMLGLLLGPGLRQVWTASHHRWRTTKRKLGVGSGDFDHRDHSFERYPGFFASTVVAKLADRLSELAEQEDEDEEAEIKVPIQTFSIGDYAQTTWQMAYSFRHYPSPDLDFFLDWGDVARGDPCGDEKEKFWCYTRKERKACLAEVTRLLEVTLPTGLTRLAVLDLSGLQIEHTFDEYFDKQLWLSHLFKAIGFACPVLKKMVLRERENEIGAESLLHLFVRDPVVALHPFKYNYEYKNKVYGGGKKCACVTDRDVRKISKHRRDKYCPMCIDEWYPGEIRRGFSDVIEAIVVLPDYFYDHVEKTVVPEVPGALVDCVRASDLYHMPGKKSFFLTRPGEMNPEDADFVLPQDIKRYSDDCGKDGEGEVFFYLPRRVKYHRRHRPPGQVGMFDLHPLTRTLEELDLGETHLPTLVPFLLENLTKLKSLKSGTSVLDSLDNVVMGDSHKYPGFKRKTFPQVRSLSFDLGLKTRYVDNREMLKWLKLALTDRTPTSRCVLSEADDVIWPRNGNLDAGDRVERSFRLLKHFPGLTELILCGDVGEFYFDPMLFASLNQLRNLTTLDLRIPSNDLRIAALECSGRLSQRLRVLRIGQFDKGHTDPQTKGYCLDNVLAAAPNLEELELRCAFGRTVFLLDPDSGVDPATLVPRSLKRFETEGGVTWRLLLAVWSNCPELESFRCGGDVVREDREENFPRLAEIINRDYTMEIGDEDEARLLERPPAHFKDLFMSKGYCPLIRADLLVRLLDALPSVEELSSFVVKTEGSPLTTTVESVIEWKRRYILACRSDRRFSSRWSWQDNAEAEEAARAYDLAGGDSLETGVHEFLYKTAMPRWIMIV